MLKNIYIAILLALLVIMGLSLDEMVKRRNAAQQEVTNLRTSYEARLVLEYTSRCMSYPSRLIDACREDMRKQAMKEVDEIARGLRH